MSYCFFCKEGLCGIDGSGKSSVIKSLTQEGAVFENFSVMKHPPKAWFDKPMIFATQRGYGEMKDGWEFPGGKIEKGETPEEALKREIIEELETEIEVLEYIDTIEYDYPTFHLSMECFFAKIIKGDLVLKEHEATRWLTEEELYSVEWLPADISLIEKIKRTLSVSCN